MNVTDLTTRDEADWIGVLAAAAGTPPTPALRASNLWRIYGPLIQSRLPASRPYVVGQIGQSLDGRVATTSGESAYINGTAALTHLHRLRALVDAVVIGVGTAIADDPQLTVRHSDGAHPARVVIDPAGRLPSNAKCWRDDGVRRVVVGCENVSLPVGIERLHIASRDGGFAPADILAGLIGLGFRRVLIEGGPKTLSRFVAGNLVDRLHIMIAPMIIGAGPSSLQLPPIANLEAAMRPTTAVYRMAGGDILCDCDLSQQVRA